MMASKTHYNKSNFNLGTICSALGRVRTEWFRIGVQLGIPHHKLKDFESNEKDPLSAVVECCLNGDVSEGTEPFSWQSIVEALKSDYVSQKGLAEEISKKYCQMALKSTEPETTAELTHGQSEQIRQPKDTQEGKGENLALDQISQVDDPTKAPAGHEVRQLDDSKDFASPSNSPSASKLDPKVIDDKFTFDNNLRDILGKYAIYVDCIRDAVQSKRVAVEDFQKFLESLPAFNKTSKERQLILLADGKQELEKCETITDIFDILKRDYATFVDYEIFQSIIFRYDIRSRQLTKLNYPANLKHFVKKHIVTKFPKIKSLLKRIFMNQCFRELVVKFDLQKLDVKDLKESIAKILDLNPSALQIVDIEGGCIVVTFLIPFSVAEIIFTPDTVLTSQQQDQFKAASVLWLKCNGCTFDFQANAAQNKELENQITSSYHNEWEDYCYAEEWKEGAMAKPDKMTQDEEQTMSPTTNEHITVFCPEHDEKVMELFCETCEETICWSCAIEGGMHHSNNHEVLDMALNKKIPISLATIYEIKEGCARLDALYDEISNQQAAIEKEIHNTDIVDVRKTELISQLHQLTQDKLKTLAEQRNPMKTIQAQLNRHLHSMRETSNHPEAMLKKITAVRQVKELATPIKLEMPESNAEADMKFYASISDCTTDSQSYGLVIAGSLPFKCQITEMVTPISPKLALLETVNSYNQPLKVSMESITCELVSELTGTRVEASVERRGQSQYQISYQPTIKGKYQLHIKVEGQHIRGSPFSCSAWSPVVEVSTPIPILTISGMEDSFGVAVNLKGEMVMAEWGGHCVTVFSPSGERLRSFGNFGSGLGQFKYPYGVAVDEEENIFVADNVNHRIQKFTAQGEFLAAVGTEGTGPLKFNDLHGIAFNTSNGRVYVADYGNERISILNSDLSYYGSFKGRNGFTPVFVTCDSTGNVYVADFSNHCIQVFTAKGSFLSILQGCGEGRGTLEYPCSIAVDFCDRVYVSEWCNHRISVFTANGQFVTSFGQWGKEPGQFRNPRGIAVDSNGVVYVCDRNNNRLQIF